MVKIGGCELVAHLLCVAGIACLIVAQVTDKWTDTGSVYSGLWRACTLIGTESCTPLAFDFTNNLFLSVTKIVHLVGAVFCAIALLLGGCGMCKDSRAGLVAAEGGMFITAAVFVGIASGIYLVLNWATSIFSTVTNLNLAALSSLTAPVIDVSNYGYSYWISWASCGALLIGGIWMCCASCSIKKQVGPV